MSKQIALRGRAAGRYAIVDDDDFERLSMFKWNGLFAHRSQTVYARTAINGKTVYMHSMVCGFPPHGFVVDHIDRDGLNNAKSNLRHIHQSENAIPPPSRPKNFRAVHTVRRKLATGEYTVHHYHRKTRTKLPGLPGSMEFETALDEIEKRTKLSTEA